MNQKTRHYLFLFFVFLFCIITPAISLYASGYKINKGFKLQKTGILIIDSNPADAKIYIDNEIQQNFLNKILQKKEGFTTTPEKIKNILPGEYKVRIEKENYWPWEKKLTIQSGETTFAEDIRLFKKDLPIISQKGDYLDAKVYLIDDKLITITDNKVIFQTEKDKTITHQKDSKTDIQIKISPRKEKIIIDKYIYDLQNPENAPLALDKLVGITSENIQWGKNDNELYYINGSLVNKFDINDNKFTTLFRQINIKDYLVKNDLLYFINTQNQSIKLNTYDLNKEEVNKTISLPLSKYSFQNTQHHLINLYDKSHKILYLIQPDSPFKPLQESLNNVENSFWLNDENIIYTDNFEIWKFNLNSGEKTLLTRISSEIENIIAHPKNNYILFLANNTINVLELDDREKYNITKILELKDIKNLMIDEKGDTIYFSSQIGSQKGIFKLAI